MPLPQLPGIIQSIAAGLKPVFGFLREKLADLAGAIHVILLGIEDTLLERVAPEKRRWVLLGTGGVFAAVIVVVIMGFIMREVHLDEEKPALAENTTSLRYLIPPDELFLPEEPDFVPGVLLEREQRLEWTAADAVPLWQDPLRDGEQSWRNLIEKTIDDIMESVP